MNSIVGIWEDQVLSTGEVELADAQLEAIFGAGDADEGKGTPDEGKGVPDEHDLSVCLRPRCEIEETKTFTGKIIIDFDHFRVKKDWQLKPTFR
jgi:hypothetical protein